MRRAALPFVVLLVVIASVLELPCAAWASTWTVRAAAGALGEAHASPIPSAPTGAAATCAAPTTAKTVKITWNTVAHASTYSVYDSTTSATGTYSLVTSGVTTNSYTSGTLTANKNYWFEVTAVVGSNWVSANSSATSESTINSSSPYCVQP